jgi:hypothetical protein
MMTRTILLLTMILGCNSAYSTICAQPSFDTPGITQYFAQDSDASDACEASKPNCNRRSGFYHCAGTGNNDSRTTRFRFGFYCPAGQTTNIDTGACDDAACVGNEARNNDGICEVCPSGDFDDLSGACKNLEESCTGGMIVYDLQNQKVSECLGDNTQCNSVTGSSTYDNNFDYCGDLKSQCDQVGGTYGAVNGENSTAQHICLQNSTTPTCSDNAAVGVFKSGGTDYDVACTTQRPPDNVCDGTRFDCDGDMMVDDQDGDGCTDNGGSNGSCVGSSTGNSRNSPEPWNDPLNPAVEGAGDCDPTSQNYSQCIGDAGLDLSTVEESIAETNAINQAILDTLTAPDDGVISGEYQGTESGIGAQFMADLYAVPLIAAASNLSFAGNAVCPTPTFDAFGQTFMIDMHCTLHSTISGTLSVVMFALFSLIGFRHVMSA